MRARHAGDAVAGDELGEVAPVRADVGERARRAAERRARRASCRPRGAAASPAGSVPWSEVERAGGAACARARAPRGPSGRSGRRTAPPRRGRPPRPASTRRAAPRGVERERLLADDVLAGGERRLGERRVQVVRRADVDDVDVVGDSTSSSDVAKARSAPRRAAARSARSRRRGGRRRRRCAPARRADRAWTAPMKPVPAMPTRRA